MDTLRKETSLRTFRSTLRVLWCSCWKERQRRPARKRKRNTVAEVGAVGSLIVDDILARYALPILETGNNTTYFDLGVPGANHR